MNKIKPKTRARLDILNYVVCFSTVTSYEKKDFGYTTTNHNVETAFNNSAPVVGSLVRLSCASFSKWYLSWIVDIRGNQSWDQEWLLESIEDGSLCWWSNVQISTYSSVTVALFPQWRWTDEQYAFWDRWERTCRRLDAYITLPKMPIFTEDGGVILKTRTRFGLDQHEPEKKFQNWKKVKVSEMKEFYLEASSDKAKELNQLKNIL